MTLQEYIDLLVAKNILVQDGDEYFEHVDNECFIEVNCPVEQNWTELCSLYRSEGKFYANLTIDSLLEFDDAMTLDDIRISKVLSIDDIQAM